MAKDFISRPKPTPRPLLFVLKMPRARDQIFEDTSLQRITKKYQNMSLTENVRRLDTRTGAEPPPPGRHC